MSKMKIYWVGIDMVYVSMLVRNSEVLNIQNELCKVDSGAVENGENLEQNVWERNVCLHVSQGHDQPLIYVRAIHS